jgi:hypothetical protein
MLIEDGYILQGRNKTFQFKTHFARTSYYTFSTSCAYPMGHGDGQRGQIKEKKKKRNGIVFLLHDRRKGRKVL